jgi:hypothetical protein
LYIRSITLILASMTLRDPSETGTFSPSDREALLEALLLEGPELTFRPRSSPDPRLKRLVAILVRQAARECYEEEFRLTRERRTTAPQP